MCNNVPKKYSAESTFLFNTSAMRQPFQKLGERFTELFRRKSFVHWYINEGMDEMEFT
jgi:tubulin beta